MIESWMVSAIIGIATYISIFLTVKNKTENNEKEIEEIKVSNKAHNQEDNKLHLKMFEKLDDVSQELAEHKVKLANAPSMEQVDAKFVSKEMFKQMEKHIDDKFDNMGKLLEGISNNQGLLFKKIDNLRSENVGNWNNAS